MLSVLLRTLWADSHEFSWILQLLLSVDIDLRMRACEAVNHHRSVLLRHPSTLVRPVHEYLPKVYCLPVMGRSGDDFFSLVLSFWLNFVSRQPMCSRKFESIGVSPLVVSYQAICSRKLACSDLRQVMVGVYRVPAFFPVISMTRWLSTTCVFSGTWPGHMSCDSV